MSVFREYDIRGVADRDLSDDFAIALGQAIGEDLVSGGERNVFVGGDARLSTPRLKAAVARGLSAAGLNVRVLPLCPTPLLYFAASVELTGFPTSSGVMVTGSHNPPEYNGFKLMLKGKTLFGDDIQKFRPRVEALLRLPSADGKPYLISSVDRGEDYLSWISKNIKLARPLKVVIDAGNGAAGPLALELYRRLGCEVFPLYCEPDGRFPNHHPDPTVPALLQDLAKEVRQRGADLGIGFDGDGDRIGVVSSTGRVLYGDHLVLYFARDILQELPGATIISEVKSSQILYDQLKAWGAKAILWKTGHSLIKAKLKETGAALAGEMSGHMFFAHRFFGFDDAIYAGARLIEGLASRKETLDTFLDSLPPAINTPEIRVDCPDDIKFSLVSKFTAAAKNHWGSAVNDIDGARISFNDGWGLVRASNTQPVLVFRFEATNLTSLKAVQSRFESVLKEIGHSVVLPTSV